MEQKKCVERYDEFGDYVVKIENEQKFDRRIKNGAARNKYVIYGRDILYYRDEKIEDEIKVIDLTTRELDYSHLQKGKNFFSYQNEYRYLLVDEFINKENIRFDIGNLGDITTIMSESEFLDTL